MKKTITSLLLVLACTYANAQKVQVLDRCESLDAKPTQWFGLDAALELSADHQEGTYAISSKGFKPERLRKIYAEPVNTGVTRDNGYLAFWFFVEKPDLLNGNGQVAISSGGSSNTAALGLPFGGLKIGSTKLAAGWNTIIVPLNAFKDIEGGANLAAINYFRIVLYNKQDDPTPQEMKIDHIRFASDKAQLEAAAR